MKKSLAILLSTLLLFAVLAGCAQPAAPKEEDVTIRLGGLTGPTTMGMVKLLKDNQEKKSANAYDFTIAGSADELTPKLVKGELDIVAVPANLASVLYNNTEGAVQLLAVNTLGVLYLLEQGETVQSLADLKGRTIFATGKGSTPEYVLKYLLSQNGLDPDKDVTIEWKAEPAEIVALLPETQNAVAMLPQPYVTVARSQLDNLRVAIDLNQVWDELDNDSTLITGVLVVRTEFAEKHPEQIAKFLTEYQASTEYVNQEVETAATLVEEFVGVKAPIAKQAIPYCNITFLSGAEMKTAMTGYLEVLYDQNPKSIGGAMPEDGFYYAG